MEFFLAASTQCKKAKTRQCDFEDEAPGSGGTTEVTAGLGRRRDRKAGVTKNAKQKERTRSSVFGFARSVQTDVRAAAILRVLAFLLCVLCVPVLAFSRGTVPQGQARPRRNHPK